MSDIVGRLRERARYDGWATEDVLSGEAADEITRLRAENEKLREALIRIDGMATTICMKDDAGYGIRAESVMPIYETARAALEGTPK